MKSTCRPKARSEEHTSELQSRVDLVCRLLLEKKKKPPSSTFESIFPCVSRVVCLGLVLLTSHRTVYLIFFFFFNDTATTEIYTLSLHDALPIGPAPVTSTRESGSTPDRRHAQIPTESGSSRPAASSLMLSGIAWTKPSGISTYSANAPSYGGVAKNRMSGHRL